jgi:hypothetical protein
MALMMEAVSISETLVNFYETTRRNIADGCLHIRRRVNMKPHTVQGDSPDDGGSKQVRIVGQLIRDYTVQYPVWLSSSYSVPRESEIRYSSG